MFGTTYQSYAPSRVNGTASDTSESEYEEYLLLIPQYNRSSETKGSAIVQKVDVYTDGGCLGNPGPGGWAALIYEGPKPIEISGHEKATTNQRMELRAAIQSLRYLGDPSQVRLHSDSAYLINGMKQKWYAKWQENGWLNSKKKPVENPDLWKELIELSGHHTVEWVKVKGHSGVRANERCDALVQLEIVKGRAN